MYLRRHNRKESTIKTARYALSAVSHIVFDVCGDKRFSEVDEEDICGILNRMEQLNPHTKRVYIRKFGRLLEFCTGKNAVIESNMLWSECDTRRIFIMEEDWKRIKDCIETPTERLVVMLGAYMGLRASEMCSIQMSDMEDGVMAIHGKGHGKEGKLAYMPIPNEVGEAIADYLEFRRSRGIYSKQLLIQTGCPYRGKPMNRHSITSICNKLSDRSGVRFTPHSLRRLFATTVYELTNHDLKLTTKLTRHEDAGTLLRCYLDPSVDRIKSTLSEMSSVL